MVPDLFLFLSPITGVVGDYGVGKTSLCNRFTDQEFKDPRPMVLRHCFAAPFRVLPCESATDTELKIDVWYTYGQERFGSLPPMYFRGIVGCLLVFDVTNRASFDSITHWLEISRKMTPKECVVVLVGTKADLEDERQVSTTEGREFATAHNIPLFFEASAKNSAQVDLAFSSCAQMIFEKIKTKQKQIAPC